MKYKAVDEFLSFMSVVDNPQPASRKTVRDYYLLLRDVRQELIEYVGNLMGHVQFEFELKMPAQNVHVAFINYLNLDLELVHFPFMTCSMNVWEKLIEDKDNPVFRVIKHINENVLYLRAILTKKGVDLNTIITAEVLNKYNIMDVYCLRSFEYLYHDAAEYLT